MIKFVNAPQDVTVSFFDLKTGEFFRHTNCLCIKIDESCYMELKIKDEPNGFPRFLGPYHCNVITLTPIARVNLKIKFV
jgi:hypothetical protein